MATAARRRLRCLGSHLQQQRAPAAAEEPPQLWADPDPPQLAYTPPDPAEVVAALNRDGAVLLKEVIPAAVAARLSELLTNYEPLPHEEGMQGGPSSQNALTTLFQRDPDWLALVDPSPVVEAMDEILSGDGRHGPNSCHIITMKGWRNLPGYHGAAGAAPGVEGGGFHIDETWGDARGWEIPEDLVPEHGLPPPICTALTYLNGASADVCPTRVIPGTHLSGRRPKPDERSWHDRTPMHAVAGPGDVLIFRCDVWHASGNNISDQTRLCVETAYSQRKISQKFYPYLNFQLAPRTREAATERQMRLLGYHPVSN